MRMTPEVKLFLYLVTMDDAAAVCQDRCWPERYHVDPTKLLHKLQQRHYLRPLPTGFELTDKGRAALADISDWLWVHQYYLPGVVDCAHAKRYMNRSPLRGYPLVVALLDAAQQAAEDDNDYLALLLRHRLKLEFGTHHDRAALETLMQLIYRELDMTPDVSLENFNYHSSWLRVTSFEKQLLTQLLGRLNQTVDDFEMAFAQWLQTLPSHHRFFTNFEVMTIVMYELGNDQRHLDELYHSAAMRRLSVLTHSGAPHSAEGFS